MSDVTSRLTGIVTRATKLYLNATTFGWDFCDRVWTLEAYLR